jgi:transcriptional regulator with XRE-family HTH domain
MGKTKISTLELEKYLRQNMTVSQIAKKAGVAKSTVSERLKNLRVAVTKHVTLKNGGRLAERKYDAMDQLGKISAAVNRELDWIKGKIEAGPSDKDRRKWQDSQLSHCAEIRKQVELMLKIATELYRIEEVQRFQQVVLEEIANESPETRERIVRRLVERGALARSDGLSSFRIRGDAGEADPPDGMGSED